MFSFVVLFSLFTMMFFIYLSTRLFCRTNTSGVPVSLHKLHISVLFHSILCLVPGRCTSFGSGQSQTGVQSINRGWVSPPWFPVPLSTCAGTMLLWCSTAAANDANLFVSHYYQHVLQGPPMKSNKVSSFILYIYVQSCTNLQFSQVCCLFVIIVR